MKNENNLGKFEARKLEAAFVGWPQSSNKHHGHGLSGWNGEREMMKQARGLVRVSRKTDGSAITGSQVGQRR